MLYGRYNYTIPMVYKPTYNWGSTTVQGRFTMFFSTNTIGNRLTFVASQIRKGALFFDQPKTVQLTIITIKTCFQTGRHKLLTCALMT